MSRCNRRQAEDYQPKLRAMLGEGLAVDGIDYSRALERRRQFTTDMEEAARQCDVLLTPGAPSPPQADRTNTGDPAFQGPWTSCGFPAIALPSGLAEDRRAAGHPDGCVAVCGGAAPVRGGLVRGRAGRVAEPAAVRAIDTADNSRVHRGTAMPIKSLKLSNVGPFRRRDRSGMTYGMELKFDGQVNLLIGPNNVGKSTILETMALIAGGDATRRRLPAHFGRALYEWLWQ